MAQLHLSLELQVDRPPNDPMGGPKTGGNFGNYHNFWQAENVIKYQPSILKLLHRGITG